MRSCLARSTGWSAGREHQINGCRWSAATHQQSKFKIAGCKIDLSVELH